MDSTITSSWGNCLPDISPVKALKGGNAIADDFLTELFPDYKGNSSVQEVQNPVNLQLEVDCLSGLQNKMEPLQQSNNMTNGHSPLIDELSAQNEKMKQVNKELKEKSILQESQIAKYEVDLSERMQNILTTNQELECLKGKLETIEKENIALKEEIAQFQGQIYQLKELKIKKKEEDNEIADLQKDLSTKEKVQRKLKSDLENSNKQLKSIKFSHQRLWNLVAELGEALFKAGLLSSKQKELILKEQTSVTSSETHTEGELCENVKTFLHGISVSLENPPVDNSESDATTSSHNFLRPCDPAAPVPVKPLQNSLSSDSATENSTQTLKGKLQKLNTQDNNSSVATSASGSCISPRVKSFGSNYFLKTYKEVIEDPHVSDDCLDISFTELKDLRQQFSLRNETFTPISPLPPTPPPKSAKSKTQSSEQLARPFCSSKRLNFCHQQSESFDIQSNERTDFPAEQHLDSQLLNNKYTLSTKRNRDGSLKFDFSANMNTTLSLDINTLQISCTVMPTDPIQTSLSEWKNSPIPTIGTPSQTYFSSTHSPLAVNESHRTGTVDTTHNFCTDSFEQENVNASEEDAMHKKTKKLKLDANNELAGADMCADSHISAVSSSSSDKKTKNVKADFEKGAEMQFYHKATSYAKHKLKETDGDELQSAFITPSKGTHLKRKAQQVFAANSAVFPLLTPGSDFTDVNTNRGRTLNDNVEIGNPPLAVEVGKENRLVNSRIFQKETSQNAGNFSPSVLKKEKSHSKRKKRSKRTSNECANIFSQSPTTEFPVADQGIDNGTVTKSMRTKKNKTLVSKHDPECDAEVKLGNEVSSEIETVSMINVPETSESQLISTNSTKHLNKRSKMTSNDDTSNLPNACDDVNQGRVTRSKRSKKSKVLVSKHEPQCGAEVKLDPEVNSEMETDSGINTFERAENLISTNLSPASPANEVCNEVKKDDLSPAEEEECSGQSSEMQAKSKGMNGSSVTEVQTNQEAQVVQKMDELDFTGILLNPFNPSTFTPRGLFCSSVSGSSSKPYDIPALQPAASKNSHLFLLPSCRRTSAGSTCDEIRSDQLPHSLTSIEDSERREQSSAFQEKTDLVSPLKQNKEASLKTLLESDQDTIKSQKKTATNGFVDSSNSVLEESDGIESDHSLVIADIAEETEQKTSFCDVDNEEESAESPSKLLRKPSIKKPKKKCSLTKRKRSNKPPKNRKNVPEVQINDIPQGSIAAVFKTVEDMKFSDVYFKQNEHTLANAFINPSNASDSKDIVYHVLKYLHTSKANPLLNYHFHRDPSALLPLSEKCIVSALVKVCRRKRLRLQGLLESAVKTSFLLILTKDKFSIYGLSAMCRIMTEICKHLEDKGEPLRLCSELLKVQHIYTPYLIASIAGVWKEIFDVENVSDEERIFHSCIVYGVQRKPRSLTDQQWKHCNNILTTHLSAPLLSHTKQTVAFLIKTIQLKYSFVEEYILTTPLIVLAAVEGWGWAKENLINEYIIPLLVKFSEHEVNEQAFSIFCRLYVDVCNFCPDEEDPHEVLMNFFENESQTEGNFVKDAVAMAQLKLLLHKKQLLPHHITEWINENQGEKEKAEYAENLFRRRLMVDESELLSSEIV